MLSTRNQIIEIISQNSESFISKHMLIENLQLSRNELLKHIHILEQDGYVSELNEGYYIVRNPNKIQGHQLRSGLDTNWLGKSIIYETTTTSTQTLAHQLAQKGAPHGMVVVADEQTEGRGRMNRYWYSPKREGISFSLILRPNILPYSAPQLTLLTATVLAEVLENHIQIEPQIKWPNDLLIHGRKVSGILTEMQAEQNEIQYIIIGIGMNVNHKQHELPEELQNKATSLFIETSKKWNNIEMIQAVLHSFEHIYDQFMMSGFAPIKNNWEKYGYKLGEKIMVDDFTNKWQATFIGISEDGALLMQNSNGEIRKIYSAEIQWFSDTDETLCK